MIMMSRIIAVLALLTLTACGTEAATRQDGAGADAAYDGTAAGDAGAGNGTSPGDAAGGGNAASSGAATGSGRDGSAGATTGSGRGTAPGDVAASGRSDVADRTAPARARTVLFVGTSLTAGYGVGEDVAYPAVLQAKIDSAGLPFRVVNAGISGETSAGGLRRIDWSLQQPVDVLVLELGANDGLRGLDPDAMRANLEEILTRTRQRYPDAGIVLVGMEAPPNLGTGYTTRFRRVFTDLARRYDAALVPFLLDGVAGMPELNIADGIHPNPQGHRVLARTVWQALGPMLEERARVPAGR
jgi:acyl-CoA thioesterase I